MNSYINKTLSVLLAFLIVIACSPMHTTALAEDGLKDLIYTDVLPGQTVESAQSLYEDNDAYETSDDEVNGDSIFTVDVIEDDPLHGFTYFGVTGKELTMSYDETDGKILYTNVNIDLDLYGDDVTEILEEVLNAAEDYGTLIDSSIEDVYESYKYAVMIDDGNYVLWIVTRWGDVDAQDMSMIAFNLSVNEDAAEAPASTSAEAK